MTKSNEVQQVTSIEVYARGINPKNHIFEMFVIDKSAFVCLMQILPQPPFQRAHSRNQFVR